MPLPRKKRISQVQIAKELGFSQALVSMALNDRKKDISESAYKAIWNYALQHGYSPRGMNIETANSTAAATTIGYILRSPLKLATKSNFFSQVHQGLYDHLNSKDIKTVFLGSEDDIVSATTSQPFTLPISVKGIAIMGEICPDLLAKLQAHNKPIVYISARSMGKCHSILSNETESAEFLVEHLIALGHTSFAWLGGNRKLGRHHDRFTSTANALKAHGFTLEEHHRAQEIGADRKEGHIAASQILEKSGNTPPTAWICLNGLMARGAINKLYQSGIKVGTHVSVAAFDMTQLCLEEYPTITCAGTNPEIMGAEAAKILLSAINSESNILTDITIPSKLRIGESTSEPLIQQQTG